MGAGVNGPGLNLRHFQGVKQVAEKLGISGGICREHTSGAKAHVDLIDFVPGINPRPTARVRFSAACKTPCSLRSPARCGALLATDPCSLRSPARCGALLAAEPCSLRSPARYGALLAAEPCSLRSPARYGALLATEPCSLRSPARCGALLATDLRSEVVGLEDPEATQQQDNCRYGKDLVS